MAGVITAKVVVIDEIEIVIAGILVIVEIIVVDIAAGNVIVDAAGNITAKGKEKRFFRSIGLAGILIGDILKNLLPVIDTVAGGQVGVCTVVSCCLL